MRHGEQLTIRTYRPEDRAALDECVRELQEHEREIEPRMKPADAIIDAYLDDSLAQCAEQKGTVLVAEIDGQVVGYTTVFAAAPNEDPDEIDYTFGYVHDLAVQSKHRGQGIGIALLEAAEAHARAEGATCLRISVLAANDRAASLYRNLGFTDRVIELEKPIG